MKKEKTLKVNISKEDIDFLTKKESIDRNSFEAPGKFVPLETQKEPKMKFRFNIRFHGLDVPSFLFRNYKMYNDEEKLVFETSFYETVEHSFNPLSFYKVYDVEIDFLDGVGKKISGWKFAVNGISFETSGDYSSDDLMTYSFKFEVDKKTFIITE